MVFPRSFCSFRELFGHFRGSECILVIMVFSGLIWSYWSFSGYLIHYKGLMLFWSFWSFRGYFGHYGVSRIILVEF
jgi:hypothetical protein